MDSVAASQLWSASFLVLTQLVRVFNPFRRASGGFDAMDFGGKAVNLFIFIG
jgi:hypothetical protein